MSGTEAEGDYRFGLWPDGSKVLRNKFGLRDAERLRTVEYQITSERALDAPAFPPTRAGYQALHRHLVGEVYEWAGELRTVDLGKGGSRFASARFLDDALDRIFGDLARKDHLRGLTGERFAEGAAHHISALNAAHPFREVNGRAMRLHLVQLAAQAGHSLDGTAIPAGAWMDASIRAFGGDERPLAALIGGALRPERTLSPAAALEELRGAAEPARDAIKEATRTLRDRLAATGASRALAEALGAYRAEIERLGGVDAAVSRLEALQSRGGAPLPVNAPQDASARDRAHAILAAVGRAAEVPGAAMTPAP